MAADLDLTDLDAVRAWLGVAAANVEHNDALERLITSCSVTMQRLMGRTIGVKEYRQFQDGPGAGFMVLRNSPLVKVSAIVVDGRPIEPQYIAHDETTVYLSGGRAFARGRNNVSLRYTAGYDEIPMDLAQACVETVGLRWRERDRIGLSSKGLAGETTSFTLADFSPTARTVLSTYQRTAPV